MRIRCCLARDEPCCGSDLLEILADEALRRAVIDRGKMNMVIGGHLKRHLQIMIEDVPQGKPLRLLVQPILGVSRRCKTEEMRTCKKSVLLILTHIPIGKARTQDPHHVTL